MSVYAYMTHDSTVQLWNVSSQSRYERILGRKGVTAFLNRLEDLPSHSSLLLIRGDFLFDAKVIDFLLTGSNVALEIPVGTRILPVAAHVDSSLAFATWRSIKEEHIEEASNLKIVTLKDMAGFFSNELRSLDQPYVIPIRENNRVALEKHLFAGSYKGVTDLVTKFLWPIPAQWATRLCTRWGISPNQVTSLSLILAIAVGILFIYGSWFWGIMLGWVMTFLDTVDGKLARVTVTSSKWGDIFDHGIDLIHPPLWYAAWGMGLSVFFPYFSWLTVSLTIGIIFVSYIVGRLVEGVFEWWLGGFAIFCWKPWDSYFRLITARRNPNLIILTISFFFGRPDVGLEAVAIWTFISTVILLARLFIAAWEKAAKDSLTSWLVGIDSTKRDSLAVRLFTNPPATFT